MSAPEMVEVDRRELARLREIDRLRLTLWSGIQHGCYAHRRWLLAAINAHFAGQKVPEEMA